MAPRLVSPEGSGEREQFEMAAHATLAKVLALKPGAICIIYETTETTSYMSYPDLQCVEIGLIDTAYKALIED
jgi:hypothetical protein